MKEKKYMEQLPTGDVTTDASYQKTLKDVLSGIFNRGQSQSLKDAEQSIEIKQIISKPISYISCDVFYEKRTIYSKTVPSYNGVSASAYKQSPSEYDMWEVNCPNPTDLFAQAKNTVQIASSRHISNCNNCYTSGEVSCSCGNGQESCPNCNGYGGWNCGTCGGRGEHYCGTCNGNGYTTRLEILSYDENNVPKWGDKKYRCYNCSGSGIVRCGNCGGSGYITCGTCGGSRYITCRKCDGSRKVTCDNCTGKGYFLDSVNVDQIFDLTNSYSLIHGYTVDSEIYGEQRFGMFERQKNDLFVCEFVDDAMLSSLPLEKTLSNQFDEPYDTSSYMKELEQAVTRHGNERRPLNYRVRVYQQQILEAEYIFQGNTYHLVHNTSTQETLMNKNPYENIAASMVDEIKEHADKEHYKSFLASYKEFLEITNFDNVAYDEKNIKVYMKKLSIRSGLICFICGMIAQLIACIFTYFSFFLFLLSGGISIAVSLLWKYVANDKKEIHYTILAILSILSVLLLNFVFSLF